MRNKIGTLRLIGNIEGWSYLILLFVAMPLKYMGGVALAVKIVGIAHGFLFSAFIVALVATAVAYRWNYSFATTAFVASLVPFGTFFLNKKLILIEKELLMNGDSE